MSKRVIRITENDIHLMVENTVRRILKEEEDWRAHFHKYCDSMNDPNVTPDEGERLNKTWVRAAKKAMPDRKQYAQAVKKEFDVRDRRAGKTRDKAQWGKDYDNYFRGDDGDMS